MDRVNTQPVIVVNEAAARALWPGESAVGKQILLPTSRTTTAALTVVGVSGDVRQRDLGALSRAEIFLSASQPGPGWPGMVLVVRTIGEPAALAGVVRDAARSVDRDVPISRIRPMDDVLAGSLAQPQVYTALLAAFAVLALTLSAVGLYGVVSYGVAQRTREIGIRMALGAAREDVVRMVLRHGAGYALAGIVIGLGGGSAFMRLLTQLIPSAKPEDLTTLPAVALLLMAVALMASYLPARRAAQADPVAALRAD
jgi:putative ABC transport system permease protein